MACNSLRGYLQGYPQGNEVNGAKWQEHDLKGTDLQSSRQVWGKTKTHHPVVGTWCTSSDVNDRLQQEIFWRRTVMNTEEQLMALNQMMQGSRRRSVWTNSSDKYMLCGNECGVMYMNVNITRRAGYLLEKTASDRVTVRWDERQRSPSYIQLWKSPVWTM